MARTRHVIGLVTLFTLIVIALAVTGFELPLPRFGGTSQAPTYQGVKAVAAATVVRAPGGGELAFMAVEPSGNLLVTDARRGSVLQFDATGQLLTEWGPRLGSLELGEPAGVAVYQNSYYVLDRGTPRIIRLDSSGQPQSLLDLQPLGPYGLNGLAVDAIGNLYAADTGRNRILVFSPGGQLLKQVGRPGTDLGAFTQPMMLAFGPDGSFVVADWENGRLQRFTAAFDAADAWSVGFRPFGVAVDPSGRVYAPDFEHRRVEVYTPQGAALGELGAPGGPAINVTPKQVAVAPGGLPSLYVLGADAIQRLDFTNTPPPPPGSTDLGDLVSVLALVLMLVLVGLAVLSRRERRRSLRPALDGKIGLDAKNGAQGEHQQADADQELLVANQSKGKR
jgi:DNA-binding beta-propeller fold protein YncE